jgi:arginine decarboxylase
MNWTSDDARRLYNIPGWGAGYFDVGADGHLVARPNGQADGPAIDLRTLVDRLHEDGLTLPVLVRFTDILRNRVDRLHGAFTAAMELAGYAANYTAIYPIKVNQQQHVVDALVTHGGTRIGLECGSKPELMAVIGSLPAGGTIVCNGYKDAEYIRLALIARRLGHRTVLVIEKLSELELIIDTAGVMDIAPELGLRVRLSTVTSGNWQNTGGDRSKFGFTAAGALTLLARLREADLLDRLTLLHCHPGSQIASIEVFRDALTEVARTWVELCRAGAPVTTVDVGGGLGIDYEGSRSMSECSMNYDVDRYAQTVVDVFSEITAVHGLPAPDLMSESGRALTGHHAVLITNVLDTERVLTEEDAGAGSDIAPVAALHESLAKCSADNALDCYLLASGYLAELRGLFLIGRAGLQQRAHGESLYYALCRRVQGFLAMRDQPPPELDDINRRLADKYFCNMSVFQSMPDVWGIDQIFPVVPLQRLDEEPQRRAILHDLTCDSDGQITMYVEGDGLESTLPVHEIREHETYLIGFFLLGAYQEILGDMHNLFGDTDAVNVEFDGQGGYRLVDPRHADTVDELLRYVEFEPKRLMARYREKLNAAGLKGAERAMCLQALEGGLTGTTYMEDE